MNEFASEASARVTVGKLAVLAAAAALRATAPPAVVDAFVQTRLVRAAQRALRGRRHQRANRGAPFAAGAAGGVTS